MVGIIGPQGAGKSTVLSVLGGAGPFSDSRFVAHHIGRLVLSMCKYNTFKWTIESCISQCDACEMFRELERSARFAQGIVQSNVL